MYRGLLKTMARVWNPKDIQDPRFNRKSWHTCKPPNEVFTGHRLHERRSVSRHSPNFSDLRLSSLDQVDNLKTLQETVVALENGAAKTE